MPLDLGRGRLLYIRRAGTVSREFVAAVAGRASAGVDPDDPEEQMRLYARSVVVGWEGIVDAGDAPIPYTAEACIELFRAYPEIWALVWPFANSRANFRAKEMEEAKLQVKPPSGGVTAQANSQGH
jgi:hypothetical protein